MKYKIVRDKEGYYFPKEVLTIIPFWKWTSISFPFKFPMYTVISERLHDYKARFIKFTTLEAAVEAMEFYTEHVPKLYKNNILEPVFLEQGMFLVEFEAGILTRDSFSPFGIATTQKLYYVELLNKPFVGTYDECVLFIEHHSDL